MHPVLIKLPAINDPRGNLTFIENEAQIPFRIKRVYWTFDVPSGDERGGHAYYEQHELIVALSGSFDIVIKYPDGNQIQYSLNRSYVGLYIPPKTWRQLNNFSTNALSLHLSSHQFNEADYIRDFECYKKIEFGSY
jgi:hypothetical protein